jgi:hypothetical protein
VPFSPLPDPELWLSQNVIKRVKRFRSVSLWMAIQLLVVRASFHLGKKQNNMYNKKI